MKYIRLFENFEEGHEFDILDLFTISPSEVKELFFRELRRTPLDMENIQVFLDSGLVDVNSKGEYGWTPLHWVAGRNYLEIANLLISSGADLEAKDSNGITPLHLAAYDNRLELAQFLISSGADVNVKDKSGRTPLNFAAYYDYQEMIQLLKKHGGIQ